MSDYDRVKVEKQRKKDDAEGWERIIDGARRQGAEEFRKRILDILNERVGGMETISRAIMDDIRITIAALPLTPEKQK